MINADAGVPLDLKHWPRIARIPVVAAWQGMKVGLRLKQVVHSRSFDLTWLQRELVTGHQTIEWILGRPLVLDVDDAIWLGKPGVADHVARIATRADLILAGNSYIADWFSRFNRHVHIVPTGVDCDRHVPGNAASSGKFVVGWIGTRGNLRYLSDIAPALRTFLARHPDAELHVVSDQAPVLPDLPPSQVRVIRWSESSEVKSIQHMTIGIMPLPDDPWTRGKCSFKMLQYMACGLGVVVSPVGMNKYVLGLDSVGLGATTLNDWAESLEYMYGNPSACANMGARGVQVVRRDFSTEIVSHTIATLFATGKPSCASSS